MVYATLTLNYRYISHRRQLETARAISSPQVNKVRQMEV